MTELSAQSKTNNRPTRTEPLRAIREPVLNPPELIKKKHKTGKFISRLGLAALCIIPPADLALSDASFVKAYEIIQNKIELPSKPIEKGVELGAMALLVAGESVALGQILTKSKKIRNTFDDFEAYTEEKHKSKGRVKRTISKTANAPFMALQALGSGFERLGSKISERKTKAARVLGQIALDAGQVNAVGTSTVIMEETMANRAPSLGRQTYLGGLIAGSWVGAAEGVRQIYRNAPLLRPPMAVVGQAYEALTTINLSNPLETPIGSLAIGSVVAGLAYTGWKIEEFRQQREQLLHVDRSNIINL